MVREKHEATDDREPNYPRRQLGRRQKRERVAEEADQRKGPDTPEGIARVALLVLFPFEPDEEREGQHERDLERIGRHHGQQLVEALRRCSIPAPGWMGTEPVASQPKGNRTPCCVVISGAIFSAKVTRSPVTTAE